jgi:hypothetical protein
VQLTLPDQIHQHQLTFIFGLQVADQPGSIIDTAERAMIQPNES